MARRRRREKYLTTIIDLYECKVVGYSLSRSLKAADAVIPALDMPLRRYAIVNTTADVGNANLVFVIVLVGLWAVVQPPMITDNQIPPSAPPETPN